MCVGVQPVLVRQCRKVQSHIVKAFLGSGGQMSQFHSVYVPVCVNVCMRARHADTTDTLSNYFKTIFISTCQEVILDMLNAILKSFRYQQILTV